MQLSVIIVNYNVKYFLEHCLLSVIKACRDIQAEIFVADNNSTDGSRAYLEPKFPSVRFYWNSDNPGFAKTNNQMLEKATGNYILFLNPDTIVPEDCFAECLDFFGSHSDCGALGVRMTDGSGRFLRESKRSLPGLLSGLGKSLGFDDKYYAAHLPEHENNKIAVLAGAFMMLSSDAVKLTGGFDEAFFMYGEDVDLSYRVTLAGLNNYYFPGTTVIHFKGESTVKHSAFYRKHFYGAMRLFAKKHYRRRAPQFAFMITGIVISEGLAVLKNKFRSQRSLRKFPFSEVTIIAGSEADVSAAEIILGYGKNIKGVVKKIVDLQKPQHLLSEGESANRAFVFCEGALTDKDIIKALENVPLEAAALFFHRGAESIIGSADKDKSGLVIAKP